MSLVWWEEWRSVTSFESDVTWFKLLAPNSWISSVISYYSDVPTSFNALTMPLDGTLKEHKGLFTLRLVTQIETLSYPMQEDDVQQARVLIQECYVYYQTMKLSNDCNKRKCRVPVECEQNNAVYNILHYLIDTGSVKENVSATLPNVTPNFNSQFFVARYPMCLLPLPWYLHRSPKVQRLYPSTITSKKRKPTVQQNGFPLSFTLTSHVDRCPMNWYLSLQWTWAWRTSFSMIVYALTVG